MEFTIDELHDLYITGMSYPEMAKVLNVPSDTLVTVVRRERKSDPEKWPLRRHKKYDIDMHRLHELYSSGMPMTDIADILHVPDYEIRRAVCRARKKHPRQWPLRHKNVRRDIDINQLHKLYIQGLSHTEIAREFGAPEQSIRILVSRQRQKNPDKWPTRRFSNIEVFTYQCTDCSIIFTLDEYHDEVTCPYCLSQNDPQFLGTAKLTLPSAALRSADALAQSS